MSDQVPVNSRILDAQQDGFAVEWFLYLERLKDAKITEDFSSLPELDGASTTDDVRDFCIALRAILVD